jgi:hypothetical protein
MSSSRGVTGQEALAAMSVNACPSCKSVYASTVSYCAKPECEDMPLLKVNAEAKRVLESEAILTRAGGKDLFAMESARSEARSEGGVGGAPPPGLSRFGTTATRRTNRTGRMEAGSTRTGRTDASSSRFGGGGGGGRARGWNADSTTDATTDTDDSDFDLYAADDGRLLLDQAVGDASVGDTCMVCISCGLEYPLGEQYCTIPSCVSCLLLEGVHTTQGMELMDRYYVVQHQMEGTPRTLQKVRDSFNSLLEDARGDLPATRHGLHDGGGISSSSSSSTSTSTSTSVGARKSEGGGIVRALSASLAPVTVPVWTGSGPLPAIPAGGSPVSSPTQATSQPLRTTPLVALSHKQRVAKATDLEHLDSQLVQFSKSVPARQWRSISGKILTAQLRSCEGDVIHDEEATPSNVGCIEAYRN